MTTNEGPSGAAAKGAEAQAAGVSIVSRVEVRRLGSSMWEAKLTMRNLWHIRHKQLRLQDAQALWRVWASIASPSKPDGARIKIVDQMGNEVGGSRILGGSLIWVDDERASPGRAVRLGM